MGKQRAGQCISFIEFGKSFRILNNIIFDFKSAFITPTPPPPPHTHTHFYHKET